MCKGKWVIEEISEGPQGTPQGPRCTAPKGPQGTAPLMRHWCGRVNEGVFKRSCNAAYLEGREGRSQR